MGKRAGVSVLAGVLPRQPTPAKTATKPAAHRAEQRPRVVALHDLVDVRVALSRVLQRSPRTRLLPGGVVLLDSDDEAAFWVAHAALSVLDVDRPHPRVVKAIRRASEMLIGNKLIGCVYHVRMAAQDIGNGTADDDKRVTQHLIDALVAEGLLQPETWANRHEELLALLRRYTAGRTKRGQTLTATGILSRIVGKSVKTIDKAIGRAT